MLKELSGMLTLENLYFYLGLTLRLVVACILGGIIGYERENTRRPAGFRTHILVCVGSALVMVTSEYIFKKYMGVSNMDPARLGAQVISGIGFLGAGTIMREGFSVKGLTTAASLWAVSCVGLAAGIGFYEGAIAATVIIYLTLISLKKVMAGKNLETVICVEGDCITDQVGSIGNVLGKSGVLIKNIEVVEHDMDEPKELRFFIKIPKGLKIEGIVKSVKSLGGIDRVHTESL